MDAGTITGVRVFYLFAVPGLLLHYFDVTLLVLSSFDYLCFPTCAGVHYETVQHDVLVFVDLRERHSQCAPMLRAPPGNRNFSVAEARRARRVSYTPPFSPEFP